MCVCVCVCARVCDWRQHKQAALRAHKSELFMDPGTEADDVKAIQVHCSFLMCIALLLF
jgi:hypothetical protein